MRHVIVGNGPAGVIAAETLRSLSASDDIVLLGDEPEPPYARMAIPYLLAGDIDATGTHLRKEADHFSRLGITLHNAAAKRIDTQAHTVALSDGGSLNYDRLLLATGSVPADPAITGIGSPGVMRCWTLADARTITASVRPGMRVLQLGAGFIGSIIMKSITALGASLTVVEMSERVVPRMMPPGAALLIKRWCENNGVRILTGTKAMQIDHDTGGLHVRLDRGETLDVDCVIASTGVRPKIDFLVGSGITTERGILVDNHMRTTSPDVYAAGDCAEATQFGTDTRLVNAVQPNAVDQARNAALNMAGHPTRSQGALPINVLDTFGLISASFGQWGGVAGGENAELTNADAFRYLHLEFREDILIGATCLGLTEHVGVLRGLIQSGVRLGSWKGHLMRDPTQVMAAYLACAQAAA